MKIQKLLIFLFVFLSLPAFANDLTKEREQVAREYIQNLADKNYKAILQLFEKNAYVVSTSRGRVDAKEFFYGFLPNVVEAHAQANEIFSNVDNLTTRFHFDFKMKDGEVGGGEYIDEFVFTPNSTKLAAVFMFENLKFESDDHA